MSGQSVGGMGSLAYQPIILILRTLLCSSSSVFDDCGALKEELERAWVLGVPKGLYYSVCKE